MINFAIISVVSLALVFTFFVLLLLRYFLGVGIGAPYLPIHTKYLRSVMESLEIGSETTVLDLGSGDGKILIEAAKRGACVIGYELNPVLVWISRHRLKTWGSRAMIYRKNLFEADLSEADVIFVFGITGMMDRLAKKILNEAKPDATIVSFAFRMNELKEIDRHDIALIYRIPNRNR